MSFGYTINYVCELWRSHLEKCIELGRLKREKEIIGCLVEERFELTCEQIAEYMRCPVSWAKEIKEGKSDGIDKVIENVVEDIKSIQFAIRAKSFFKGLYYDRYNEDDILVTDAYSGKKFLLRLAIEDEKVSASWEEFTPDQDSKDSQFCRNEK